MCTKVVIFPPFSFVFTNVASLYYCFIRFNNVVLILTFFYKKNVAVQHKRVFNCVFVCVCVHLPLFCVFVFWRVQSFLWWADRTLYITVGWWCVFIHVMVVFIVFALTSGCVFCIVCISANLRLFFWCLNSNASIFRYEGWMNAVLCACGSWFIFRVPCVLWCYFITRNQWHVRWEFACSV